jgi:hypothetical protein
MGRRNTTTHPLVEGTARPLGSFRIETDLSRLSVSQNHAFVECLLIESDVLSDHLLD